MLARFISRSWYYARTGYITYIGFVLGFFGATSSVYYLAVKAVPALEALFPSYLIFLAFMALLGVPFTVVIGLYHFKRSPMFKSEVEIQAESNIYNFKALPGRESQVIIPTQIAITMLLLRLARKTDLLTQEEKELYDELIARWFWLQSGRDIRKYKSKRIIDINQAIMELLERDNA